MPPYQEALCRLTAYPPINIPTGTAFASRQRFGSPSDTGLSAGGSPPAASWNNS
ncbi:hypothetical protein EDD16DRAFT_1641432 [Pisolithus croceorrhizus]|nr:hypothetical protein EDD16DRAFT_1641432 [Pisolithus croceorrhizus]